MKLYKVIEKCHIRSAIRRKSKPSKKYWKNQIESLESRVPLEDINANDWEEYDPRDDDDSSLFSFND